mgnify:FL=1
MGDPNKWQREMEIDWKAAGGNLVYPYFIQYRSKIVIDPFPITRDMGGWFTAGMDHGTLNPTCFLVMWVSNSGEIYLVWEYYSPGHYLDHSERIKECPWFDKVNGQIWCDPSMSAATQQTAAGFKSMIELYAEEDISLMAAPRVDRAVRAQKIGAFWHGGDLDKNDPVFRIFGSCKNAIEEFRTLRYESYSGITAGKKNKHEGIMKKADHAWDCTSYIFSANAFFAKGASGPEPGTYAHYMAKRMREKREQAVSPFYVEY